MKKCSLFLIGFLFICANILSDSSTRPWFNGANIQNGTITSNSFDSSTVADYIRNIHTAYSNGVFAYLTTSVTMVVTNGAYSPISGSFSNYPVIGFIGATQNPPGIKYAGSQTAFYKIDWHATIYSTSNDDNPVLGIKKNNNIIISSLMGVEIKNATYWYQLSGTCVVELQTDDEIQLVLTTDDIDTTANITIVYYTTTIKPFFY